MLEFAFMRHALIAGLCLSIIIPMIGIVMVNRKTSMIGDALSHASLSGVAMGLILGFEPVWGVIIVCLIGAFCIEYIRQKFPHYGDMATAVITSAGLGIAAVLSKFAPGGNTFDSYLFGSISAVTLQDVIGVLVVFVLVVAVSIIYYAALLDIAIDTDLARLAGVNVRLVNTIFTFLAAITIALSCKIVGALLVLSILVLPVATALIVSCSYKVTFIMTVILGVIYTMCGIIFSYYYDVPTGGAIVILAIIGMLLVGLYKKIRLILH